MEAKEEIDSILMEFRNGNMAADECFCIVLSLIGYDRTKQDFLHYMESLRKSQPRLHTQLYNVYMGYFESTDDSFNLPDKLDCSVENGFYASDSYGPDNNYDADLELAMKLSLGIEPDIESFVSTSKDEFSYANILSSSTLTTSNNSSANKTETAKVKKMTFNFSSDLQANASGHSQTNSSDGNSDKLHLPASEQTSKSKRKRNKKGDKITKGLSNRPVIYWFRRDLRLFDNPALVYASQTGASVIPVFLWSEAEEGPAQMLACGGATKYWLHMALPTLNRDMIERYNNPIVFRKTTNYLKELLDLINFSGAKTLVINDVYEPYLKENDDNICKVLTSKGVKCERFHSYLLHQPGAIRTESLCMRGMGSVTHFMECCRQSDPDPIGLPVDPPDALPAGTNRPQSMSVNDLGFGKLPKRKDGTEIDWAKVIRDSWDFSENGAWEALQLFLSEGIRSYEKESSRGDKLNTCRISPYLHFGQISPRTVLNEGRYLKSLKFLRKLAWRDLSYWLLSVFPDLPYAPTRVQYKYQRWSSNKAHLKAWQKGNTGYPLVDAAMRQLWLTGWMNNYMRHVVASFLLSYLHISWVEGYLWFQDTLLDADVAINAMMWQNGGMSGLDQWNFVMHPVDAAMTCDPKGDYIRKWIPELSRMPDEFIHKPWKCPPSILRRAGVEMGVTYPHRIITDLEGAREQSLTDVVDVRMRFEDLVDPRTGNDLVQLPNGVVIPVITRKEFKYKTRNPDSRENPHNAVLRGYRSRKRDELVEYLNQRDFMASTMKECSLRHERSQNSGHLESF